MAAIIAWLTEHVGWQGLAELALFLMQAAKDLAVQDGLAPDAFDARVSAMEKQRHDRTAALVKKWGDLLK